MKILCFHKELLTIDYIFISTPSARFVVFRVYQTSNSEIMKCIEVVANIK